MSELQYQTLELIDKALSGTLDLDEASRFLSGLGKCADRTISEAAHATVHFVTDVDLRMRDKSYDAILRAELERHAENLKRA